MTDYTKRFGSIGARQEQLAVASVFRKVYGWMAAGLAVSGLVAWYVFSSGLWATVVAGPGMIVCIAVELGLVFFLSARAMKMSAGAAVATFIAYAAVNGLTLSVIFAVYEAGAIAKTFFLTAGMFGGLAIYGTVAKADLSKIGALCGLALWGLIIAGVIQVFWPGTGLDAVVPIVGIVVFCGLTMWDAQKIKLLADEVLTEEDATRAGVVGALTLYLDFINLFLYLLRFFGRNRD